ncbi:MAG: glycosyltransferase family 2 protein [Flavobacteriales bacterium]|nr:glycosyltransferase family 2 protein [Flavobacteriales bacterium]
MLSICIPIYNFDCSALVDDLLRQVSQLKEEVEIIVIDDASKPEFRQKLAELNSKVNSIQLKENIGRSRIRNLLAEKAMNKYLLFIDGDSSIVSENFVKNYIELLKRGQFSMVICGGSVYQIETPDKEYILRWKYSKSREQKSKSFLKKHPYQSFTTNNFIIDKEIFQSILFDEKIEEYGHEDTLFGFELMKKKVSIQHVENVVLNGDLDTNMEYLNKVKLSISNLLKIANNLEYDREFIRLIPLLKVYFQLKLFGFEIFLGIWFRLNRNRLEGKFKQGRVNLTSFDLYRLGVLSTLFKRS